CSTPSSKTEKSAFVSPFTNCFEVSVTVTFRGTRFAPLRKTVPWGSGADCCGELSEEGCCADASETSRSGKGGRIARLFTTSSLARPAASRVPGAIQEKRRPPYEGKH